MRVFRPLSVPQQIDEALAMLLVKASQIGDAFEQAFFMLVHVPYLQPFADIDKRTSRLIANLPLSARWSQYILAFAARTQRALNSPLRAFKETDKCSVM